MHFDGELYLREMGLVLMGMWWLTVLRWNIYPD